MILKPFGYTELPIEFNENNHRYKLEGIPLIGTTTVLETRNKDFMKFWTVKEMYLFLQSNWDIAKTYTKEEKEKLLLEGKRAWTVKKEKALDSGKIAHRIIEDSIQKDERYTEIMPFVLEHIKKTLKEGEVLEEVAPKEKLDSICEEVNNAYKSFLDWEKEHEIEYLASELIVGSKTHWLGGTIDCIANIDDHLELLDWKTSKQLSDDVFLQLASYKMMLIEGGVDEQIGRRSVRFDKTGKGFEDYPVKSDYSKDIEVYLSLLKTYRWNRDIKKAFMDKWGKLIIE